MSETVNAGDKVKVGPWEWTAHPTLPLPTQEWLVSNGQQRGPATLNNHEIQETIYDAQPAFSCIRWFGGSGILEMSVVRLRPRLVRQDNPLSRRRN
jgi:hypothetical protein